MFLSPPKQGEQPGKKKRKAELQSPPQKRESKRESQSEEERIQKARDYEEKERARAFIPAWLDQFPWLRFDKEKNEMFFEPCRNVPSISDKTCSLYKGNSKFRKTLLDCHDPSKKHEMCAAAAQAKIDGENSVVAPILRGLSKMQDELRAGMINLFHVAYFVVKSERPFTDFPVLVDLNRRTGAKMPCVTTTTKPAHGKYFLQKFFVDIYQFIYDPILAEVKSARFCSVMIDGATDKATLEQEIVYVRYLDSTKRPKNVFFSIEHHYRFSPKALHELRLVAEALEEKVLKPTNLAGARFLPYIYKANKIVCESYAVFVTYFQDLLSTERRPKPSPKVRGRAYRILTFLMNYDNVLFSYFMRDTFEALSELSLNFQKDSLTVCDAVEALETCSLKLVDLQFEPTEGMQEVIDAVSETGLFRGTKLKYVNEGQIVSLRKKVIGICAHQAPGEKIPRSPERECPLKFAIFDPSQWPSDRQELAAYGKQDFADICEHYQPLMDEHSVTTKMLKSEFILYKSYAAARKTRMPHIFSGILCDTERCKQYKGLSILFEVYLVLAVNTAVCERGFSCMKRVKNDWRSCLGTEQLSRLMFSSIEGPQWRTLMLPEPWRSGGPQEIGLGPGFNPWQKEQDQEIRDDLYEDWLLWIRKPSRRRMCARRPYLTSSDLRQR
ncbi:hypothetical protein F7725_024285, partial [Dissostichus mawsoni]